MNSKVLLYIDIATFINENDKQFTKNTLRLKQICRGLKKLFEYNFSEKECDILITDNTCDKFPPEIEAVLPDYCICRTFNNNPYGTINKGAGLIQKWEYNYEILKNYDYIIHFEGRLLLTSFTFFDSFFSNPRTIFRYGSSDKSHYFTGLFSAKPNDIFEFCKINPKEKLIRNYISIEYPVKTYFEEKAETIDQLGLLWFAADGIIHAY